MTDDSKKKKKKKDKSRPWRDNLEAVTMAIIMAILLKYFIIEAYKIPTGSMQPTLMGLEYDNRTKEIKDRILVDKLSYHFRDPVRWEVAVFRYPLDRSKNFIKRIVGMPSEDLMIANGDVLTRKDESEEWKPLQRPRPIQLETRKLLNNGKEWGVYNRSKGWKIDGKSIQAPGPGSARFPKGTASIMDNYADGYPGEMAAELPSRHQGSGSNPVGDLYLEGVVKAKQDCTQVMFEIREGPRRYRFIIPGPASDEEHPQITVSDLELSNGSVHAEEAFKLRANKRTSFGVQNMDDTLEFRIDGDIVATMPVPTSSDQRSAVFVHTLGGGAEFDELAVYRDIFYTRDKVTVPYWSIPDDSYMMLGDNTQDSSDSREWTYDIYDVTGEGGDEQVLKGNSRTNENPITVSGGPDGAEVFFRDHWGERHHFLQSRSIRQMPVKEPFVPRHLITGRALLVFWPLVPSLDVYRLTWIH